MRALPALDLAAYNFVSLHAPSRLSPGDEEKVIGLLVSAMEQGIAIVAHPDVISSPSAWRRFGRQLLIENLDKRKRFGRTARDLQAVFGELPEAKLCFDIAHARQVDPTMTEARFILEVWGDRLAEVHISELNTRSHHDPISVYAVSDYQSVADLIPERVPIILETLIDRGQSAIADEIDRARQALDASWALQVAFVD